MFFWLAACTFIHLSLKFRVLREYFFRILFGWTKGPFPSANSGHFSSLKSFLFHHDLDYHFCSSSSNFFFRKSVVLRLVLFPPNNNTFLFTSLSPFFFFFSFFFVFIFWRSHWFEFYPVRSAIYSSGVDFNCAIASSAFWQGFLKKPLPAPFSSQHFCFMLLCVIWWWRLVSPSLQNGLIYNFLILFH